MEYEKVETNDDPCSVLEEKYLQPNHSHLHISIYLEHGLLDLTNQN